MPLIRKRAVSPHNAHIGSTLNYSAEYKAVMDEMTAAPSAELSAIYDTWVKGLVAAGIWLDLDFLNLKITATNTNSEALINWINPTGDKLVRMGAGESDKPSFTAFSGITGKSSGYINTNFNPSAAAKFTRNSASIFHFIRTKGTINSQYDYGAMDATAGVTASTYSLLGLKAIRLNNLTTVTDGHTPTEYTGLWLNNRKVSTEFEIWRGKTKLLTKTIASTGLPDLVMPEFAINTAGTIAYKSTAEHSLIGAGAGLTDEKITILNDLTDVLIASIEAAKYAITENWANSVVLYDGTTYLQRNSFSELSFSFAGKDIYIKANPTAAPYEGDLLKLSIYVNGTYNQSVEYTAFEFVKVTLPAGEKTVKLVTCGNVYQTGIKGIYPTNIVSFTPIETIAVPTVTDKIVFVGDSITTGGNSTIPEEQAYGRLFKKENSKESAFLSVGAWQLAHIAANSTLVNVTVAQIIALLANCTGTKRVSFLIGTNDYAFTTLAAATFGSYYTALVDALHVADADIVMYCISPTRRTSDPSLLADYRTEIETLCSSRDYTTYINGYSLLNLADLADGVHPTTAGHKKLKDALYAIIYP